MYAKPLEFPEVTDFSLCCAQAEKWVHAEHVGKCLTDTRSGDRGTIYCSIRQHDDYPMPALPFSMRLTLTEESAIAKAIQNMRKIVSDSAGYHCEVVIHDDGNALVIAKYSSILGSRYVAAVKTETIMPVIAASLAAQTRDELRRRAKVAKIDGRGSMSKDELVLALLAEMAGE